MSEPKVELTYYPVYGGDEVTIRDLRVTIDGRPLVVIDPDSAPWNLSKIRSYLHGLPNAFFDYPSAREMLLWLAEQVEPVLASPKPDEPTGLGAVVEDDRGRRWVRVFAGEAHGGLSDEQGPWKLDHFVTGRRLWVTVDAVRVLSEGVTP